MLPGSNPHTAQGHKHEDKHGILYENLCRVLQRDLGLYVSNYGVSCFFTSKKYELLIFQTVKL